MADIIQIEKDVKPFCDFSDVTRERGSLIPLDHNCYCNIATKKVTMPGMGILHLCKSCAHRLERLAKQAGVRIESENINIYNFRDSVPQVPIVGSKEQEPKTTGEAV